MTKITVTQEIDITPELLAKLFSEMDNDDQAIFFNELDFIFHSWGEAEYKNQIRMIVGSDNYHNGDIFIHRMYKAEEEK